MQEPLHILFHIENCCIIHGCQNGDPQCPIVKRKKTQFRACQECLECGIIKIEDMESLIRGPNSV